MPRNASAPRNPSPPKWSLEPSVGALLFAIWAACLIKIQALLNARGEFPSLPGVRQRNCFLGD